jgi:hypothetical protein
MKGIALSSAFPVEDIYCPYCGSDSGVSYLLAAPQEPVSHALPVDRPFPGLQPALAHLFYRIQAAKPALGLDHFTNSKVLFYMADWPCSLAGVGRSF